MKPILGPLYMLQTSAWNAALCHLDTDFFTAKFEVALYSCIGRPAWPNNECRERWLKSTLAQEIDETELNDETKTRLGSYELMAVGK
jgi:hypothetical protein